MANAGGYGHSRRDQLAAAKLDALGVDWDRGKGAYRQYRALSVGQREQSIQHLRERDRSYRPGGRRQGEANPRRQAARARGGEGRYPAPRAQRQVGDATASSTSNAATVLGLVRDAARKGDRVLIRATFIDDKGRYRTKDLDRYGGRRELMALLASMRSRAAAGIATYKRPVGPVTVTTGPGLVGPRGDAFDALDWLGAFDVFGDVWDAIYATWDAEYA